MTMIFGRHLLSLLLMLTFAQSTTGWWWRDRLLSDWLRPAAEYLVSRQLGAQVHIDELQLDSNRLRLAGLRIEQPKLYRFELAQADIRFTIGGLWRRQLETVALTSLRLDLLGPPSGEADASAFPEHPPIEIGHVRISDGDIRFPLGGRPRRIRSLELDLHGTRRPRFLASARLGEDAGLPVVLAGTGNWDRRPGLILTRFDWDGATLLDEPLQFQLDRSGASVAGSARLPRLDRAGLERVAAILALPLALPEKLDFSLQSPELALVLNPDLLELRLSVPAARIETDGSGLEVGALVAELQRQGEVWTGKGRLTLERSIQGTFELAYAESELTGEFTCVVADLDLLLSRYQPERKGALRGGGILKGRFSSAGGRSHFLGEFSGRRAAESQADYRLDLTPVRARLSGEIRDGHLQGEGSLLLEGRELATLTAAGETLKLELDSISLDDLAPVAGPALFPAGFESLERLSASAELRRGGGGRWQGRAELAVGMLRGDGLELNDLTASGRFRQQPQGVSFDELQLTGQGGFAGGSAQISLAGSAALAGETFQLRLTSAALEQAEYFSPDGLSGLVDGRLLASGQVSGNLHGRLLGLSLTARLGAGEVLHGLFYANLADTEARLDLQGGYDLDARQLTARSLTVEIPELAAARLKGSIAPALIDMSGAVEIGALGPLFEQYLKGSLESAVPGLAELSLAGALSADFALQRSPEVFAIRGSLQPQDLDLGLPSAELEILGLGGLLPLAYRQGGEPGATDGETLDGVLYFTSCQVGPASLENAPLRLTSSLNRIELAQSPLWNLADGTIRISDLSLAVEAGQPVLAARIGIDGIDLETLTRELETVPMAGTLSADLGEIRYADRTLSSAGQAVISAFGGTAVISNIRLRDPASRYRTLLGDIDLTGIDLYQLTRTFEFGEMNGILDGYIHNLRLFGTVPSQFEAELATRESGRRNISVKALNNLSILSQGGLSAALSRGIYRFIDFYRYQKIGLRCTLNNDVFRLQGTAREDSDDYLVYGGLLPPKIDIIAPGRDISFKEMLKRLSRIDRAGR